MTNSLRHVIGQTLFVGLSSTSLKEEEKSFLVENNIGGVILFDRNIENPEQLFNLILDIQKLRPQMPSQQTFFIGIDMEGGRVQRLKAPFTVWPAMKNIGELDSPSLGFKFGEAMGNELRSIGINVDFAPCVDVLTNPSNEIIGDRAFSTDSEMVAKLSSSVVRGFIKSGIIPCSKHFPGHGNTLLDSHEELPVEEKTLEELSQVELPPFKRSFRARLDLVMTAHILYPKIDPDWPATMSEIIIKKIAREQLGYRNLVISDDLEMKALSQWTQEEISVQSLKAGCNILLYCHELEAPARGLDAAIQAVENGKLSKETVQENYKMVLDLKKRRLDTLESVTFDEAKKMIGHPDHLALAKAIKSGNLPDDLQT